MKKLIIMAILIATPLFMIGDKLGTLTQVFKPAYMEMDQNEIIIGEGAKFYVFSTKDLTFIKKFGKKGSGPGEILDTGVIANPITIIKDGYFVEGLQKLVFFDKAGKLVREIRKNVNLIQTTPFGEKFVVQRIGTPKADNNNLAMLELCLLDKDLNFLKKLTQTAMGQQGRPPKLDMVPDSINFSVYEDKLYVEESHRGFVISVFDENGKKLYEINKDFVPIKLTADDKERILEGFKKDAIISQQIKAQGGWNNYKKLIVINYPKTFPLLQELNVASGKLYASTYEQKDSLDKLIIMDLKGKILKEAFMVKTPKSSFVSRLVGKKSKLYKIINDTVYYLHENVDDEEWEIHTFKIK
jgi:hypothetical protein